MLQQYWVIGPISQNKYYFLHLFSRRTAVTNCGDAADGWLAQVEQAQATHVLRGLFCPYETPRCTSLRVSASNSLLGAAVYCLGELQLMPVV